MKAIREKDTLVIIPVFNEERNIGNVITDLLQNYNAADILIINDGSTDGTGKILREKGVLTVNHAFNIGIGASFETGCKFALAHGYKYIVRLDGDGQHSPVFIGDLLRPLKNGATDIVIGSRFLGHSKFKSTFSRLMGIFIIAWFLGLITGRKITDPTSGFCAMNRRALEFFAQNCPEDFPEPEILIHHREFRIQEVPISINRRTGGSSSITIPGSVYYMFKVTLSLIMHLFRGR